MESHSGLTEENVAFITDGSDNNTETVSVQLLLSVTVTE
jgi:hypothetical protein